MNKQETTPAVEALFNGLDRTRIWVPGLWWLEVANALQMGVRLQRFSPAQRSQYLNDLRGLPIQTGSETSTYAWNRTLVLADQHHLTVYDAAYLELALRRTLPLATLDRELRTAAPPKAFPCSANSGVTHPLH